MVEVVYRGRSEPQRVRDELKNIPSARANSVTEQVHRTIVTVYHCASQAPSDKGFGGPDEVSAFVDDLFVLVVACGLERPSNVGLTGKNVAGR